MTEDPAPPVRLCFVCLGNICRSPTAAAVMVHRVAQAGLAHRITVESAGTGDWHVGEAPDRRAVAEARRRGIEMTSRGRQFVRGDFARFELVLAMDASNVAALRSIAPDDRARAKIRLLRSFDPKAGGDLAVPDPYFGGPDGFAMAFDRIDAACRGLLAALRERLVPP
ncbi:MAG: low molecular weight protein-tyrosine phosphatase [Miltoncostaeaceae bacterium]|nr:low molecular weight protein-tyrosine phosphatase [Miltoncostaeaceae bacterium]